MLTPSTPAAPATTFISGLDPVSGSVAQAAQGGQWPADLPIGPGGSMKTVRVSTEQLLALFGGAAGAIALTLLQAQAKLPGGTDPAQPAKGQFYEVQDDAWNAGQGGKVLLIGAGPSGYWHVGQEAAAGLVTVDVAAGTYAPIVTASHFADLLGAPGDNAALAAIFQQQATATDAQKQRIDALLAGANGAVDTFIEAYNRFVADENAAAALNGQVSNLQQVQTQQGQQIAANTATGLQNATWIGTMSGLLSTAKDTLVNAYNELFNKVKANTTAITALQANGQLTPAQVQALNPLTHPIMLGDSSGKYTGYDDIDSALAASSNRVLVLNGRPNLLVTQENGRGPLAIYSYGATIKVADGVDFRLNAGCVLSGTTIDTATPNGTGTVAIVGGGAGVNSSAGAVQLYNSTIYPPVVLDTNALRLQVNSQVGSVLGNGNLYLYDSTGYGSAASGVTVNDKRPGTGGGSGFSPVTGGDGTKFLSDKGDYRTPGGGGGAAYTAGTGISIDNGVITNTLPRLTAANAPIEITKLTQYQHVTTTQTRISFNTNVSGTDIDGNGVFTAPKAGIYIIAPVVLLQPFGSNAVYVTVTVHVNGVETSKVGEGTIAAGHSTSWGISSFLSLQAGDQVEVRVKSEVDYSTSQLEVLGFPGSGQYTYFQVVVYRYA